MQRPQTQLLFSGGGPEKASLSYPLCLRMLVQLTSHLYEEVFDFEVKSTSSPTNFFWHFGVSRF